MAARVQVMQSCPAPAPLFGSLRCIVYNRVFTLRWWDFPTWRSTPQR